MKMFKKLMAIALAGVMALAVLTGCGTSLNEKEIIKQMNDELKFGAAFGSAYDKYKEFKADKEMGAKAVTIAKKVAEKAKDQAGIKTVLESDDVKSILVGKGDTNVYKVSYVKSVSYGSKYYQTNKDSLDLTVLWLNAISYNDEGREVKDAVVGVGFADATVGGSVYTIVVMKVPTQKIA
ncbi:MAG: hypothetical protein PUF15_00510 [Faecalibacterium prausnitzii]|nr:hypothetical protein [Faecalibacterium prausnitzii]